MKTVRCAIYTRKSSDEGLEQAFNSLDAQREACAAYILSQASEGWTALPDIYDDGGLSGGTLERPALQRLLAEVAAGHVDIIVVYKVDRLTRSLLDFSKLVEMFDTAGTSFVSVTQSFNTTTSMGRLTLNMLLSFAQFEREVTAERIRDKIAASKAKGMWMGGIPPLGYAPNGRTLSIIPGEANLVRDIFERYLAIGNVRLVVDQLTREGILTPYRTIGTGRIIGGVPFSRGQIYKLLSCPTYIGRIAHRDTSYPGQHEAILTQDIWDRTQALLAEKLQGSKRGVRSASPSLLAGLIVDANDEPLIATHATKGKARYRYYVSKALHTKASDSGMRIPAREIETAVRGKLADLFADGIDLATTAHLDLHSSEFGMFTGRCSEVHTVIAGKDRILLQQMLQQVRVHDSRIEVVCDAAAIATALSASLRDDAPGTITLIADVRLTRSGRAMRLIQGNGAALGRTVDSAALRLLVKARRWWLELRTGEIDVHGLAAREGVMPSYITRVVKVAFLAPRITDAILAGTILPSVDAKALTVPHAIAASWDEQARQMLPG